MRKHTQLGVRYVTFHLTSPDKKIVLNKVRLSWDKAGPDVHLMVDAWRMCDGRDEAEMARRWEPYRLYLIEEPVRRDADQDYLRMVGEATDALLAGVDWSRAFLRIFSANLLACFTWLSEGGDSYGKECAAPRRRRIRVAISFATTVLDVKGGAKLDHFGGAKLDQLGVESRFCFEFLWDGWNVA